MYKLYLDDIRMPVNTFPLSSNEEWTIVRGYGEFVKIITEKGLPEFVSFDHDLADEHYRQSMYNPDKHYTKYYTDGTFKEKTGFECAKWLTEYCMNKNQKLPEFYVHSANPIGKENINGLLESFKKSQS